jgi:hypothetical protein
MGKKRNIYRALVGKLAKKRDHLQDSGANGKIILKLMSNRKARHGLD